MKHSKVSAAWLAGALLLSVGLGAAESKKSEGDLQKGYQLAKKHCTRCHDSVANPEAGPKTRDEWIVVISLMHKKFPAPLSHQEQEQLVNYFYNIRKGLEKDPG